MWLQLFGNDKTMKEKTPKIDAREVYREVAISALYPGFAMMVNSMADILMTLESEHEKETQALMKEPKRKK